MRGMKEEKEGIRHILQHRRVLASSYGMMNFDRRTLQPPTIRSSGLLHYTGLTTDEAKLDPTHASRG